MNQGPFPKFPGKALYIDTLMHILMGLTNDNLKHIRKTCRELDCLEEDAEEQRRNDTLNLFMEKVAEQEILLM